MTTLLFIFLALIHTWSVGRRLKSFGGFVITYLLPGASGPALLSRNLNKKRHSTFVYFSSFFATHVLRLFRFLHIIRLHFCVANYLVLKTLDVVERISTNKFVNDFQRNLCNPTKNGNLFCLC